MRLAAALVSLTLAFTVYADASTALHLPIGDPDRANRTSPVVLDAITDTATNELLTPAQAASKLRNVRILFLGEEHTDIDYHRAQLGIIRALHEDGREVIIALEMFPYTSDKILERWRRGRYEEDEFVEKSEWARHWGYRWGYYRDIFSFAREHRLKMVGVNAPRTVIRKVRTEGFASLDPKDARHIPVEVDTDNAEHERLFRAYFDADDAIHAALSEEAWGGMFRAQCTWDAVMGWNALQAARENPAAIVVVLIGAGHATYGLGAERQIRDLFDGRTAALQPVPIADRDGNPTRNVQSSYANYIWGLPPSTEPFYPTLGISLLGELGDTPTRIIQVDKGSNAAEAGLQVGDVLTAIDGQPVDSIATLRAIMGNYYWGDAINISATRDNVKTTFNFAFRRKP